MRLRALRGIRRRRLIHGVHGELQDGQRIRADDGELSDDEESGCERRDCARGVCVTTKRETCGAVID